MLELIRAGRSNTDDDFNLFLFQISSITQLAEQLTNAIDFIYTAFNPYNLTVITKTLLTCLSWRMTNNDQWPPLIESLSDRKATKAACFIIFTTLWPSVSSMTQACCHTSDHLFAIRLKNDSHAQLLKSISLSFQLCLWRKLSKQLYTSSRVSKIEDQDCEKEHYGRSEFTHTQ